MKTFADMIKDLKENEELKLEAMKVLNSDELKITEEQYGAIVAFGKEHGYEFTEEDIHLYRATNREMDDSELELIAGGNSGCDCNDKPGGGKGNCAFSYACEWTWNTCTSSNECSRGSRCNKNAV